MPNNENRPHQRWTGYSYFRSCPLVLAKQQTVADERVQQILAAADAFFFFWSLTCFLLATPKLGQKWPLEVMTDWLPDTGKRPRAVTVKVVHSKKSEAGKMELHSGQFRPAVLIGRRAIGER